MAEDKRGRRTQHLSLVARIAVAVLALGLVLHGQDWGKLAEVFGRLSIGRFALTLGIYVFAQLVIAFRWWVLLRAQSVRIPASATIGLHLTGLFFNNVMPGSVGGDLIKAWYVAKHTHKRLEGVFSVLVDRLIGLSGMLLMAIAAYLIFLRGRDLEVESAGADAGGKALDYGLYAFWAAGAIAVAVAAVLVHPRGRARARALAAKVWERGRSVLGRMWQALVVYGSKPLTMLCALALTIFAQSMVVVAFWLLGRSLGMTAGLKYYFVIFPVTWVIGAIPISVAGLGVLEGSMVGLFTRLTGAAAESALALGLCQRFVWVLGSLPGAAVHMFGGHLPKEFSIDEESAVS